MDTIKSTPEEREKRIKAVLEEMRPNIQLDGGDMEFVSYNDKEKIVYVELKGACVGCPMSSITLKQGIEYMVQQEVPEVKEVVNIGMLEEEEEDEGDAFNSIESILD